MSKVRMVASTQIDSDYLEFLMKECPDTDFINGLSNGEGLVAYCARVSSPNPTNPDYKGLLKYCAKHAHWSVFEQIDVTFEIETSLAICQQILRHKSLCFQQFSMRYAKSSTEIELYPARRQDSKNRQNSFDDMDENTKEWFEVAQKKVAELSSDLYEQALNKGIAKEQARFLLPQNTKTKLFAKGSLRSWIHYIQVRADKATQKEHREIAEKIKEILIKKYPTISGALEWT